MVISTLPVGGKPEFAQADGKGCDGPSGLAIDSQKRRLFAVCGNKLMAVVDPDAGKVLATLPVGAGADGAVFDNGYASARTARTIGADSKTHKLYLPGGPSRRLRHRIRGTLSALLDCVGEALRADRFGQNFVHQVPLGPAIQVGPPSC